MDTEEAYEKEVYRKQPEKNKNVSFRDNRSDYHSQKSYKSVKSNYKKKYSYNKELEDQSN